jgi:hypothetical protein
MNFELDMEDYTIILNALHYYKKVEKRGNFKQYDEERINKLRDIWLLRIHLLSGNFQLLVPTTENKGHQMLK